MAKKAWRGRNRKASSEVWTFHDRELKGQSEIITLRVGESYWRNEKILLSVDSWQWSCRTTDKSPKSTMWIDTGLKKIKNKNCTNYSWDFQVFLLKAPILVVTGWYLQKIPSSNNYKKICLLLSWNSNFLHLPNVEPDLHLKWTDHVSS